MFSKMAYVYEIYKEKSFSKASDNLFIAQSSLSATIKKVEGAIGSQIFDRSTNPIQLTDCGKEYIKCIEQIMEIQNNFENYLNDLTELKAGSLSIGASNFFASYILPPIIASFQSKYPRVTIKLTEADTAHLEKQLFTGALDLIVDNYNFDETVYKKYFFYSENLILAVPGKSDFNTAAKKYRLTANDIMMDRHLDPSTPSVPLQSFKNAPYILLRRSNDTRVRADKICQDNKLNPHIILEVDQLATAYHIACHGMGVTLTSDTLVKNMIPDERIIFYKLNNPQINRDNYFYYKQSKYVTKPMEEFLRIATS